MAYFEKDPVRFHYHDRGEGRPIVFLHGLGADLSQPVNFLKGLENSRIISLDFRGHGLTYAKSVSYSSMEQFADDLLALVHHLNLHDFVLGGISLGSAVSLKFAIKYSKYVGKLIAIRPAWINVANPPHFRELFIIHDLIQENGIELGLKKFLKSPEFLLIQKKYPSYATSLRGQFTRNQAEHSFSLLRLLPSVVPFKDWQELQSVDVPSLVIASDHDPLHPLEYGHQLADKLPKAQFRQVHSKYLDPNVHRGQCLGHINSFIL